MNKNDFPEQLKKTITDLGFDLKTMWLIDEEKGNNTFYLIDEFDIWFPVTREYRDFVMSSFEIHRKKKDNSFSIDFIQGKAMRYFRNENITKYHSEMYFLYDQEEPPSRQRIVEQLRGKMFDKHIGVERRKFEQLVRSSMMPYDETECKSRHCQ